MGEFVQNKINRCLIDLYDEETASVTLERIQARLRDFSLNQRDQPGSSSTIRGRPLNQSDAILITYGDQVHSQEAPPLRVLAEFCHRHLRGVVSGVHLLPFFPYSSDDGFSVIDYRQVDPALGSWGDIACLGESFSLMFDLVINHVSAQSEWFQAFLRDEAPYSNYFIIVYGNPDLSRVVRPRTLPLLTHFDTPSGSKAVWTTFSEDQIDLNYKNPDVLLSMVDVLLYYVSRGAEWIRLDAIAYLWKEPGTSCIHLPQTHQIVRLLRLILDQSAPWVRLITETNVPHAENISYFGDGKNEAQLVYNFSLPPLVLHTMHSGDCQVLSAWVNSLKLPSGQTTFFNFLASHDGIGLNPARGILGEDAIQALVEKAAAHGGFVSYKANPDGTQSPYELNVNYFDALSDPQGAEPMEVRVARFCAAHAIMFSLVGVPGIYFHSLFGSSGWSEGVVQTGRNRTVNRQKLPRQELEADLSNFDSQRRLVFQNLAHLLRVRASHPAFQPHGQQRAIWLDQQVFTLLRTADDHSQAVLCLVNLTSQSKSIHLNMSDLPLDTNGKLVDLISGVRFSPVDTLSLELVPYQAYWLAQD